MIKSLKNKLYLRILAYKNITKIVFYFFLFLHVFLDLVTSILKS
jgi:hypothetical protein